MGWWKNFDPAEVKSEFTLIRSCGLSCVRVFLLWEDFMSSLTSVCNEVVENLVTVAEVKSNFDKI
jgi:hypothetical protein